MPSGQSCSQKSHDPCGVSWQPRNVHPSVSVSSPVDGDDDPDDPDVPHVDVVAPEPPDVDALELEAVVIAEAEVVSNDPPVQLETTRAIPRSHRCTFTNAVMGSLWYPLADVKGSLVRALFQLGFSARRRVLVEAEALTPANVRNPASTVGQNPPRSPGRSAGCIPRAVNWKVPRDRIASAPPGAPKKPLSHYVVNTARNPPMSSPPAGDSV